MTTGQACHSEPNIGGYYSKETRSPNQWLPSPALSTQERETLILSLESGYQSSLSSGTRDFHTQPLVSLTSQWSFVLGAGRDFNNKVLI